MISFAPSRLPVFVLTAALLVACAGPSQQYLKAKYAGDRAKSAGRYDEAARAYHDAAGVAKRPRDRDEALYLEAATLEEAGRTREAMDAFAALAKLSPGGDRTDRAIFDRAFLEIDKGDEEQGYRDLEAAMLAHPAAGSARRALRKLVEREEAKSPAAAEAYLTSVLPKLAKTELDEDAQYLLAKELEKQGKLREARDAYVRCAQAHPYPFGSLADDSWWNASQLDEKLGDVRAAIDDLRTMLAPREVSTMGQGSYERPRFSPGQFRIAVLTRDGLHDDAAARREFHRVYTDFPTSILRADALFEEAILAKKDGDDASACDVVHTLVKEMPESRYAGCATELCAKEKAPEKAPKCRSYLEARIRGEKASGDASNDEAPAR